MKVCLLGLVVIVVVLRAMVKVFSTAHRQFEALDELNIGYRLMVDKTKEPCAEGS